MNHKWENAFTLDKGSWGFVRDSSYTNYMTPDELMHEVVSTVAYGGNCLINVGPTADGRIVPIFQSLLLHLGDWLGVNGEAIYGTSPCPRHQNDTLTPDVFFTCSFPEEPQSTSSSSSSSSFPKSTLPALTQNVIFFKWPSRNSLTLGAISVCPSRASMLGLNGNVHCLEKSGGKVEIDLSGLPVEILAQGKLSKGPWTLKMIYL